MHHVPGTWINVEPSQYPGRKEGATQINQRLLHQLGWLLARARVFAVWHSLDDCCI